MLGRPAYLDFLMLTAMGLGNTLLGLVFVAFMLVIIAPDRD